MERNVNKCVMVIDEALPAGLLAVDFSDVAQSCNIYDDYIQKAAAVEETGFHYLGIGIYGEKRLVNKLTGSLPLLR